ncbi:MAG: hypothetical protein P4L55_14400 [Syntrophobacteraceae bacterium]|nr:hypothetical protein [Syntrophobacteraceae bacterium]
MAISWAVKAKAYVWANPMRINRIGRANLENFEKNGSLRSMHVGSMEEGVSRALNRQPVHHRPHQEKLPPGFNIRVIPGSATSLTVH